MALLVDLMEDGEQVPCWCDRCGAFTGLKQEYLAVRAGTLIFVARIVEAMCLHCRLPITPPHPPTRGSSI